MNEDRIWEMYYSDVYQASTQRACRERIDWLQRRARGRVLDVGCSQGVLPILLAREGFEVVGVDVEEPGIEFARARLAEEPEAVRDRVQFRVEDIFRWRPTERFDTVVLGEVLEHVTAPREMLAAVRSLLNDGGRVLITVPLGWLEHHDHKQAFLPLELIGLLEEAFGIEECEISDEKIRVAAVAGRPTNPIAIDPERLLVAEGQALLACQYRAVDQASSETRRRGELQQRIDALRDENRSLKESLTLLRMKKESVEERVVRFSNRAAELKGRVEALAAERESLKSSSQYKLGALLVKAGLKPTSIIRLPRRLAALALESWRKRGGTDGAAAGGKRWSANPAKALVRHVYEGSYRVDVASASAIKDPAENRILHLLEYSLPHTQNGYTLRSFHVVRAQKGHGWDPVVITKPGFPDNGTPSNGPESVAGVMHYRLPGQPTATKLTSYLHTYVTEAASLIRELAPSVVQAGSNFRNAYAAMELARNYGLPFVYEVRGLWEETRIANGSLKRGDEQFDKLVAVETHCMQAADAIVTLGESLKAELVRRGVDGNKIFLVPNAVDTAVIREPRADLREQLGLTGRFVVSYIGSVSPLESLHVLIDAIRIVRRTRADVAALIVGAGADLETLKQRVYELGLDDSVKFAGSVPHGDIADYYAITDLVVCTRGRDKVCEVVTPLKPYEAMAYRKPVVVSDIPALCEMVQDEVTGRLFPAGDTAALARLLEDLADHPERCAILAEQGQAWVRQHRTWERVTEGYRPAYAYARAAFARRNGSSGSA